MFGSLAKTVILWELQTLRFWIYFDIWILVHGSRDTVNDFYTSLMSLWSNISCRVWQKKNSNVGKASCFMEKNRIKLTEPLLKSPHEVVRMSGDIYNAYMYVFTFACLCVNIYMFNTTFMHVFSWFINYFFSLLYIDLYLTFLTSWTDYMQIKGKF